MISSVNSFASFISPSKPNNKLTVSFKINLFVLCIANSIEFLTQLILLLFVFFSEIAKKNRSYKIITYFDKNAKYKAQIMLFKI